MTLSLVITFTVILVLSLKIIRDTTFYRKKVSTMVGMMISMVLGMIVGLTVGVINGILISDNFFYSTVISAIVGIVTGLLAGLPIGWLAVLDGILAGLMGGMMGAMTGAMMSPEYQESLIKIMFLIYIGTIMILFRMMEMEIIKSKRLSRSPKALIGGFILIVLAYNQLGFFIPNQQTLTQQDTNSIQYLVVKADDYSFLPERIEVTAGEMLKITLDNIGKVEHDLEIIGIEAEIINSQTSHKHSHNNNPNQIHLHSLPEEKQEVSFIALTPGEYRYICTIPGHVEYGMTGIIEVSPTS